MTHKTLLVISVVLLVGTVGVWVRSYWMNEQIHYIWKRGHICLSWSAGGVGLGYLWGSSAGASSLPVVGGGTPAA